MLPKGLPIEVYATTRITRFLHGRFACSKANAITAAAVLFAAGFVTATYVIAIFIIKT